MLPLLYIVSIVASVIGETSAYFVLLSAVESALLLLILQYAWRWRRHEDRYEPRSCSFEVR